MENKYYNVSSVRLMRYLYSLGFNKESYINDKNKENWRFFKSDNLDEAIEFYHYMRNKNMKYELVICQILKLNRVLEYGL